MRYLLNIYVKIPRVTRKYKLSNRNRYGINQKAKRGKKREKEGKEKTETEKKRERKKGKQKQKNMVKMNPHTSIVRIKERNSGE